MTADDIRQARHDRVASALAEANTKTGLFKRPGTTAVADPYPDHQAALNDYWAAKTPEAEREAYTHMRELGLPAGYGEDDKPIGWQPIGTAPKDGWFDVWRVLKSTGYACRATDCHWEDGKIVFYGEHDRERPVEDDDWIATHWMPLPAPPEEPGA